MNSVFKKLEEFGLIPVVKIDRVEDAVPLAKALCAAGLPAAEITFRTDAAEDSIKAITEALPNMLIGAGTVLSDEQAERAVAAGARFILSPGFGPNMVGWCVENNIPVAPGCATPTDIETAIEFGLDTVKFFPAEQNGGVEMISALSAPYGGLKFIPTGGITRDNLSSYLKLDCVLACGGSFVCPPELIKTGNFAAITALARDAIRAMFGFRLAHIGINTKDDATARRASLLIETMFGFEQKEGTLGIMCGGQFEFMKGPYFGDYGHIAVAVDSIERAMAYFGRMGFEFEEDGVILNDAGKINAAYFKNDFFGCAIHLLRKPS